MKEFLLKKNIEKLILGAILLLAAIMRFYHFSEWSLSNDELSALNRLRYDSFSEMVRQGVMLSDFHPVGVQAFLYYWTKIFGLSVFAVRLPFVVFGIISVLYVFKISNFWFGKTSAYFTAILIATLEFPILYSQLARPYSPGLLFSMMSIWFWTKILFLPNAKNKDYVFYVITTALAAYSHNISFLFVLIAGILGLFYVKKKQIKAYLIASLSVGVLYIPNIKIFFHQMSIGGIGGPDGWLGKPENNWLFQFIDYSIDYSIFILIIIISISGIFLSKRFRVNRFHLISLLLFFIPFSIAYYYSIYKNPILQNSILLFSFPFLSMFFFSFYKNMLKNRDLIILSLFALSLVINTVFIQKFYQKQHFGEFKGVAEKLVEWDTKYHSQNITYATSVNGPYYLQYYLNDFKNGISFSQIDNRGDMDLLELKKILDSCKTNHFAYAWTKPVPMEVNEIIQSEFPILIEQINYSGLSEVSLYSKDSTIQSIKKNILYSQIQDFENSAELNIGKFVLDSNEVYSGKLSANLESILYGPSIKLTSELILDNMGKDIHIGVWAKTYQENSTAHLVFNIKADSTLNLWYASKFTYYLLNEKWGRVVLSKQIPTDLPNNIETHIYLWNPDKEKVIVDDLSVEIE